MSGKIIARMRVRALLAYEIRESERRREILKACFESAADTNAHGLEGKIVTVTTPGGFALNVNTGKPQQYRVMPGQNGGLNLEQVCGQDEVPNPIVIHVAGWKV